MKVGTVGPEELSTTLRGDTDQKEHSSGFKESGCQKGVALLGGVALLE